MKREQPTLRMESALVEKAKRVVREHGISVPDMITGFFDGLKGTRSQAKDMV